MKHIITTFMLLFSTAAFSQSHLKIQTLNFNAEAENTTLAADRYPIIRDYIKNNDVDIAFFQEDWHYGSAPTIAVQVAQDLGYDVFYHFEDGVTGLYDTASVIIAKKSFHFRNPSYSLLPHSAVTVGNGTTVWASFGQSNILIGGTVDLPTGQAAMVWTTHLAVSSQPDRLDQINFAVNTMKQYASQNQLDWNTVPTFIGGDMNSLSSDPEAALYASAGFVDSWNVAHPGDPGFTMVNDPLSSEYNPMVHSAGEFPTQYDDQGTGRFDYIYYRNLANVGVGSERVFTAPQGRIWMSDHYSVVSVFNFDGSNPGLPDADSNMAALGSPTFFNIDVSAMLSSKLTQDFDVTSLRGFTIQNSFGGSISFMFLNGTSEIYNTSSANLSEGDIASFTFFAPGNFTYKVTITDPVMRNFYGGATITGTVHVH